MKPMGLVREREREGGGNKQQVLHFSLSLPPFLPPLFLPSPLFLTRQSSTRVFKDTPPTGRVASVVSTLNFNVPNAVNLNYV